MSEICEMFASTFLSRWLEWKAVKKSLIRKCIFCMRLNLKRQYIKLVKKTIQLLRGIVQRGQLKPSPSKSTTFKNKEVLNIDSFTTIKKLGSGSFGLVNLV